MQVGFKTGPRTWEEGKRIIEEDRPTLCEVWFRIDRASEYDDMLSHLQRHEVKIGLHHWGLVDGKYKTNLATKNETIRQETIQQIKDAIDVGVQLNCAYVNAHPGSAQVEIQDLESGEQVPIAEDVTDPEESAALFLGAAEELQAYAQAKNVVLTLETLPGREQYFRENRDKIYDPFNVPLAVMGKLGAQGNWLANDFTHTLASLATWETDEQRRWDLFMAFSKAAVPFTRLLHANTLVPPFNGTDSHDGVTDEDFALGVVPGKEQIRDIFRLFADRDDVFVIPEPHSDMQANFHALQALAESI